MELRLTADQEKRRAELRELLRRESPIGRSKSAAATPEGFSRELWRQLAHRGFLGAAFENSEDARGEGFLAAGLAAEELARFRVPAPFLTTTLCGLAVKRWGTERQKLDELPKIASGDRILAFADAERGGSWDSPPKDVTARRTDTGFIVDGEKLFVPFAHVADRLLVTALHDEETLLLFIGPKTPGVSVESLRTVDWDRYHRVTFDGVSVPRSALLGDRLSVPHGMRESMSLWGAALRCAEMVGGVEHVLELTTAFAKKRAQFGRPIGSFQAVQHRCADMAVDVVSSRLLAYEAIWRLDRGLDAATEVSTAKAWVGDAYERVCSAGHQIHGALGYTQGHTMHLFTRHARSAGLQFGDAAYHRELLAQRLGI